MKEKLWPAIARMAHATRRSTQHLIQMIQKKISKEFFTQVILQRTDELSIHAAAALWHPLELNEIEMHKRCNQTDISSYNNLMEILNSLLQNDTL
jgi:hypothetical protein